MYRLKRTFTIQFITGLLFTILSSAQVPAGISALKNRTENELKIEQLNKLTANSILKHDSANTVLMVNSALTLSEKMKFSSGMLGALINKSKFYLTVVLNPDSCLQYADRAITLASELKDVAAHWEACYIKGECLRQLGRFAEASTIFLSALKTAELNNYKHGIAYGHKSVGLALAELGDYRSGLIQYKKAHELFKNISDTSGITLCLFLEGIAYEQLNKHDQAMFCQRERIKICENKNDFECVAYSYNEIASILAGAKKVDEAIDYARKAYAFFKASKNSEAYCNSCVKVSQYLIHQQRYDEALPFIDELYTIAVNTKQKVHIRSAYWTYSQYYAGIKDYYKACLYYDSSWHANNALFNEKTSQKVAEMSKRYETERNSYEIEMLKKDAALKEAAQYRKDLLRYIIYTILTLAVGMFFLLYNQRQLRQKNKLQLLLNEQEKELLNVTITTQDNERKRFAEDLHDSLGSILSAAKLNLARIQEEELKLSDIQLEKYHATLRMIDEATSEMRNIAHGLMPATLSQLGLVAALQNLADTISAASAIQIHFSTYDLATRLKEALEISIYRIILEIINNAVKHSGATQMIIQIIKFPAYIAISVEDNGTGFKYREEGGRVKGIGITNLLARVKLLKGKIDIDSSEGKGTTINIEIPETE